ncbi:gliding motility protein GldL [uncultured Prevotella sp.]|uniref:type IX secretion system motor protein PorL/GldL n=1 Tax=uncultured Prevotella sp. TaxID=159272 RepID=UPI0025D44088|nr:gliding motility protein GldL [uncultured Prevotella sp.]
MTVYSKFNIVYHLQKWMDSVPGQTFLNYAYSWGASVVILGTLFKLTHLPGANIMLFAGMGTEVFVFFLSAFDRPFDKTQDGKELPTHIDDEEIDNEEAEVEAAYEAGRNGESPAEAAAHVGAAVGGGGTIIIGGAVSSGEAVQGAAAGQNAAAAVQGGVFQGGVAGAGIAAGQDAAAVNVAAAAADFAANREVAVQLADAQASYLEQLKNLTETLQKVSEQSVRLTRDSEEMENLNRTLTGICKVYEMQLKGASQQIGTIDQINEQSRHMAQQIEQLNSIYARMIEAMTVNMNLNQK